ncbi:MAG: sugar ABC transporter substrate-binding protein [Propionibacteriaceae bacterium]|jgi:N,N'-diacetylchitobiose transport system substrate-binding protein|nr:sugar ABC transporter substrate-binding protein [Propionibacteriaceae bacterium]
MKSIPWMKGVTLAAVASLALTGCSGGQPNADPASSNPSTPANAAGQTLTVWIMQGTNPKADDFLADVTSAFKQKTGADLKVELVAWSDAHDRFTTAMAGGTTPDVAETGNTWTPEFAGAGALVPIDDYIKASNLGSDLVKGLTDAGQLDGKQYGMPWYAGVRALMYNTEMFTALNLKPPTTWAEIESAAAAIKAAYPDKIAIAVPGSAEMTVYPWVWGAGGQVASESGGKWKSELDSTASQEGLSFWTGLAAKGYSSASATTWTEANVLESFAAGNIGMALMGSWTPKTIVQKGPEMEGKFAATPIPAKTGGIAPSVLGGSHLSMFSTAKNKDLAWEFMKMMTTGTFAEQWGAQAGYFPGQKSLLEASLKSSDPLVAPFVKQFVDGGGSVPVSPAFGAVQAKKTTVTMMQSILSEKQDVAAASKAAADEMTSVLNAGN